MSSSTLDLDRECKKIIETKDYYDALNIDKSASQEEIRKAYKKVSTSNNNNLKQLLFIYLFV